MSLIDINVQNVLFYFFAALALVFSVAVVLARHPVHAVLSLVATFISTAIIWLLLESEFLAVALVLVYVGAVMVLFLFVVMMLEMEQPALKDVLVRHFPLALAVAIALFGLLCTIILGPSFDSVAFPVLPARPEDLHMGKLLGEELFTNYLVPFEIAGVILFSSIVAAIVLTHRNLKRSKKQNVTEQIKTRKEDRLKIISMPSEKRESDV